MSDLSELLADPKAKRVWTAAKLEVALAEKFCAPEFAFFPQVRNQTGYNKRIRTADGLAMSLWPSRGLHLHGFEIKISRSDWLAEKRDPSKAEEFQQYCDFWWMVLSDPNIIQPGELPVGWGVITPRGSKLAFTKEAQINTQVKLIDRTFLAGLLRTASESATSNDKIQAEREAAFQRGKTTGIDSAQFEITNLKSKNEKLAANIEEFRQLSGVNISAGYMGGSIGKYVQIAQRRDWQEYRKNLDQMRIQLRNMADEIDDSINMSRKDGEICDWTI